MKSQPSTPVFRLRSTDVDDENAGTFNTRILEVWAPPPSSLDVPSSSNNPPRIPKSASGLALLSPLSEEIRLPLSKALFLSPAGVDLESLLLLDTMEDTVKEAR